MVAAVDDHEVLDATGDVELAVDVDAVVAGAQPLAVVRGALGVAALGQTLGDAVVEGLVGLFLATPVTDAHVLAVQPDLADLLVGHLGAGLGVDDRGPLAARDVTAGDLRDGVLGVGLDAHDPARVEGGAVDVDDLCLVAVAGGGDEQGGLGHAVGRLDRRAGQTVRAERLVELAHRRRGDRLAAVDQADDVAQVEFFAGLRDGACRGVLEREVRGGGEGAGTVGDGGELADPAARPGHEGARAHDGDVLAADRGQDHREQAHVVEQRQPGHAARRLVELDRVGHLDDIGEHRPVGDLDAGGNAGRAGGVLQVRDVVGADGRPVPGLGDRVGDGVDGDHAGTLRSGERAEELPHAGRGRGGGEDRAGSAVAEDGVQAIGVTGLVGIEQRHSDGAGVDRGEEGHDVVEALRSEDRDAVAGSGDLLQARGDGLDAHAELIPGQLVYLAVAFPRVVDVPVGEIVTV